MRYLENQNSAKNTDFLVDVVGGMPGWPGPNDGTAEKKKLGWINSVQTVSGGATAGPPRAPGRAPTQDANEFFHCIK